MEKTFRIEVESYAGHKGAERPRRFVWKDRSIEVAEIADRWYGEDADYFKVRGGNGITYLLRYVRHDDQWELVMADKRGEGG